jgi:hypothetical protein
MVCPGVDNSIIKVEGPLSMRKRQTSNSSKMRLTLLGVGAMNSPRYKPAGLLVKFGRHCVMIDGGPGAEPCGKLNAWLVSDDRCELIREIRALAETRGVNTGVDSYKASGLSIQPRKVVHTNHPTYGYEIVAARKRIVWAPEFLEFPHWAAGADLMFAEGAGWNRPIRFAKGVGGHAAALEVARQARRRGVSRLVIAHIGRPTKRAMDAGEQLPFGEFGVEGKVYTVRNATIARKTTSVLKPR